ncbi:hypothetical protein L3X38_030625 [Prunus dulcis]|uniref:NAC domain-containing protein n=1 Tax=Prunus dulcis TaxID=3755 RepID=A0AAD4VAJ4_PRUDU|nr:hypothetical protein L3X38_030625 [Prunus dulcis]
MSHENVPLGFRFHPTDQELVGFFLSPEVVARETTVNVVITQPVNPEAHGLHIGHGGTWSETESSKQVEANGNSNAIGRKQKFRYENQGSEEHTTWLLDEYSLFVGPKNNYTDRSYDFNFVICRMRKNDRSGLRKQI